MKQPYILILYFSRFGHVEKLAEQLRLGVESETMEARLRTVPTISKIGEFVSETAPPDSPIYCKESDLMGCSGLLIGSPTRFGNMAAPLKYFIDGTSPMWISGALVDKPAGVFTSTASLHGGQESTLLSMALPLIHHGMIFVGLPYSAPELHATRTGGTPYGASHWAEAGSDGELSEHETALCQTLGKRLARLALMEIPS